jgi:hypothetical protein
VSKVSCLGTKRSSRWLLHALVRSEGQRGSGELEVFDLGLCPEHGRWWRLGFTLEAEGWGRVVTWV